MIIEVEIASLRLQWRVLRGKVWFSFAAIEAGEIKSSMNELLRQVNFVLFVNNCWIGLTRGPIKNNLNDFI